MFLNFFLIAKINDKSQISYKLHIEGLVQNDCNYLILYKKLQ